MNTTRSNLLLQNILVVTFPLTLLLLTSLLLLHISSVTDTSSLQAKSHFHCYLDCFVTTVINRSKISKGPESENSFQLCVIWANHTLIICGMIRPKRNNVAQTSSSRRDKKVNNNLQEHKQEVASRPCSPCLTDCRRHLATNMNAKEKSKVRIQLRISCMISVTLHQLS